MLGQSVCRSLTREEKQEVVAVVVVVVVAEVVNSAECRRRSAMEVGWDGDSLGLKVTETVIT